jgi:hypothetical protein
VKKKRNRHRRHLPALSASAGKLPNKLEFTAPVTFAAAESGEDGKPKLARFSMVAYNGGPLMVGGWYRPVVVDLNGLSVTRKSRPVLRDHDPGKIVGHTSGLNKDGGRLTVDGIVSGSGEHAQEVLATSANNFPWQASIGVAPSRVVELREGKTAIVNGQQVSGPAYIVRQGQFREVSFVALGADDDTSVSVAAKAAQKGDDMDFDEFLDSYGLKASDLTPALLAKYQETYDRLHASDDSDEDDDEEGGSPSTKTKVKAKSKNQKKVKVAASDDNDDEDEDGDDGYSIEEERRVRAAESRRIAGIHKVTEKHPEIAAKAIEKGWTPERAELEVLRASRPKAPAISGGTNKPMGPNVYAAAILLDSRQVPEKLVAKAYGEQVVEAAMSREYRQISLGRLCYDVLEAHGQHVRGGQPIELLVDQILAIEGRNRGVYASSQLSPISLTGILSDSANKALLAGFYASDSFVPKITMAKNAKDFKPYTWYRMYGKGAFKKLGKAGEFESIALAETSYSGKVDTSGAMLTLSRQDQINDDLGALIDQGRGFGSMAIEFMETETITLLLAADGSFFQAGNGNYMSGAATALDIPALSAAEQLFLEMKTENGNPTRIMPKYLVVPPALKATAENIYKSPLIVSGNTKAAPANNINVGKYEPICIPQLAASFGGSDVAWYLWADPAGISTPMIAAYLNGVQTPTIMPGQWQVNKLAIDFTVFFDFGISMAEQRAAVKSKGSA